MSNSAPATGALRPTWRRYPTLHGRRHIAISLDDYRTLQNGLGVKQYDDGHRREFLGRIGRYEHRFVGRILEGRRQFGHLTFNAFTNGQSVVERPSPRAYFVGANGGRRPTPGSRPTSRHRILLLRRLAFPATRRRIVRWASQLGTQEKAPRAASYDNRSGTLYFYNAIDIGSGKLAADHMGPKGKTGRGLRVRERHDFVRRHSPRPSYVQVGDGTTDALYAQFALGAAWRGHGRQRRRRRRHDQQWSVVLGRRQRPQAQMNNTLGQNSVPNDRQVRGPDRQFACRRRRRADRSRLVLIAGLAPGNWKGPNHGHQSQPGRTYAVPVRPDPRNVRREDTPRAAPMPGHGLCAEGCSTIERANPRSFFGPNRLARNAPSQQATPDTGDGSTASTLQKGTRRPRAMASNGMGDNTSVTKGPNGQSLVQAQVSIARAPARRMSAEPRRGGVRLSRPPFAQGRLGVQSSKPQQPHDRRAGSTERSHFRRANRQRARVLCLIMPPKEHTMETVEQTRGLFLSAKSRSFAIVTPPENGAHCRTISVQRARQAATHPALFTDRTRSGSPA